MSIQINDRITLKNNMHGVVRYIGPVSGRNEEWVGIELDEAKGSNNGTVNGTRYFYCQEKHGLFVKYEKLTRKMKNVDESLGFSQSIISNIADTINEDCRNEKTSEKISIFDDEAIRDKNDTSNLIEENRTYKELLETAIRRYSEALSTIKDHLKILQSKIESIKIRQRPATEKDKVRRITLEMIEANNRGDKKRFSELYEVFKMTMEKYQIKVE